MESRIINQYSPYIVGGVFIIIILGLLSMFRLPVQLLPSINYPQLTITTEWNSASAEEIEELIIQRQERVLRHVSGVRLIESTIYPSFGSITMTLSPESDLNRALIEVTNRLNQVTNLPLGVKEPKITVGGDTTLIMYMFLHSTRSMDSELFESKLNPYKDRIRQQFNSVDGVSRLDFTIDRVNILNIVYNPHALAFYNLTIEHISEAVNASGNVSLDSVNSSQLQYTARYNGKYELDDIANLAIAHQNGRDVFLRDVATVTRGIESRTAFAIVDGLPALGMAIYREPNANVLSLTKALKGEVQKYNEAHVDDELKLKVTLDNSVFVDQAISFLQVNLFIGIGLACLVLMLFLRRWDSVLIVAISIPFSLFVTFIVFWLMGRTMNIISMAGIAFSIGVILDSAIVAQENIIRLYQKGESKLRALSEGVKEVAPALTFSTITTISIFFPVLVLQDFEGALFSDIALSVSLSLTASLFFSIYVMPVLGNYIIKKPGKQDKMSSVWNRLAQCVNTLTLSRSRNISWLIMTIAVTSIGSYLLFPKTDFLPQVNNNRVDVYFKLPEGGNLDYIQSSVGDDVSARIKAYIQSGMEPHIGSYFFYSYGSSVTGMGIRAKNEDETAQLIDKIKNTIFSGAEGWSFSLYQSSLLDLAIPNSREFIVDISSSSQSDLYKVSELLKTELIKHFHDGLIRSIPDSSSQQRELIFEPKDHWLQQVGMNRSELARVVQSMVGGVYIDTYFDGNYNMPIKLVAEKTPKTEHVLNLPVVTESGIQPLSNLVSLSRELGYGNLKRINGKRTVSLVVNPGANITIGEAAEVIQKELKKHQSRVVDSGIHIQLRSTSERFESIAASLQVNFFVAIFIVIVLLSILFKSIKDAFIVISIIPISIFGGLLTLKIVNLFTYQSVDFLTMLGFIILVGVVVNNGILILIQARKLNESLSDFNQIVCTSIRSRLRPIYISTLTTVLGMLPLLLSPAVGTEIYRGMAAVIIGGLLFNAVLAPFLMSAILKVLHERDSEIRNKIISRA